MLKFLFQQSWKLLLFSAITGLIGGLAGAASIAVINEALANYPKSLFPALTFFGLCLLTLIAQSASQLSLLHLTQKAVLHMRLHLSESLLLVPFKKLQALGKNNLFVILTKDIDSFAEAVHIMPLLFSNVVVVIGCLAYLCFLSWKLFIIFGITLISCIVLYHLAERPLIEQFFKSRDQTENLYKNFRGLIDGSKELQLNSAKGTFFIRQIIYDNAKSLKESLLKSLTGYTFISNIGNMLLYAVIGILVFVIPIIFPQNIQTLTATTLLLLYLIGPIAAVVSTLPAIREAGVALTKIQNISGELQNHQQISTPTNPFSIANSLTIEFQGIAHHYPGKEEHSQFLLGPVNLTVRSGEILFITGGNGSGKTTLALLILGLYTPEQGQVFANGILINDENRSHYRQFFSAVFADFHLFEHLFGTDSAEAKLQASRYIDAFDMSHKVKVVDGKFSTLDLSTGQRKRLALVSSYLEDRPVYLFDEWASDQDPIFKKIFYTELLPELKARGKTVIVISHDDFYFNYADRLVKLTDGQLYEDA